MGSYLPSTAEERQSMLEAIGCQSMEDLYAQVPPEMRVEKLDLPEGKSELEVRRILEELKEETRTIVIYEAPHRLARTLGELEEALGDRQVSLVRELTKKHETVRRSSVSRLKSQVEEEGARGECVLVIAGKSLEEIQAQDIARWEDMPLAEHMALYEKQGLNRNEAMKQVAKDRGVPKREIYRQLLETTE